MDWERYPFTKSLIDSERYRLTKLRNGTILLQDLSDFTATRIDPSLQWPLFKFTEQRYVDAFFETGSLRIGTLFDFHHREQVGENRYDEDEGLFEFTGFMRQRYLVAAQNQWMFCMSKGFNPKRMDRFGGSGFQIIDDKFILEVTRALRWHIKKSTQPSLAVSVRYIDRVTTRFKDESDFFAGVYKDAWQYGGENEARILWETEPAGPMELGRGFYQDDKSDLREHLRPYIEREKQRVKVQFIKAPGAIQYCRRLWHDPLS